jgi:hypothetical protein
MAHKRTIAEALRQTSVLQEGLLAGTEARVESAAAAEEPAAGAQGARLGDIAHQEHDNESLPFLA